MATYAEMTDQEIIDECRRLTDLHGKQAPQIIKEWCGQTPSIIFPPRYCMTMFTGIILNAHGKAVYF